MLKKISKIGAALATTITSLLLGASQVSAASYDYSTDVSDAFGSTFCFGNMIVTICCGLFWLASFGFTIWIILDVIKREETVLPKKTIWLVLLIIGAFVGFGWIVALYYYFARKKQLDAMGKSSSAPKTQ